MFVSGWRPAVDGLAVLLYSLITFLYQWLTLFTISRDGVEVPSLDMSAMMPVLLGMLGLGAMRTVEKTQKVSREK